MTSPDSRRSSGQTCRTPAADRGLLLGGCPAKLVRVLRAGSLDAGLGPTALFPLRLRAPVAMLMCAFELALGLGLIVTVSRSEPHRRGAARAPRSDRGPGRGRRVVPGRLRPAGTADRAAGPRLRLLRRLQHARRSSWRTLARAGAAGRGRADHDRSPAAAAAAPAGAAAVPAASSAAELALIAALSPELGEALVRLGYSEPCELRALPAERTLAALRRSKQWRKHAQRDHHRPARSTCGASCAGGTWCIPAALRRPEAEVVFAVFLRAAAAPR